MGPETSSTQDPRLRHSPSLDGIRALAIIAVLLYHLDVPWAKGGFLGVEMFFVLSGYLITSLLLVEQSARGTINLGPILTVRRRAPLQTG